jgi:hypothetical protein
LEFLWAGALLRRSCRAATVRTVYLVINNFGKLGTAFPETDIEKTDLET